MRFQRFHVPRGSRCGPADKSQIAVRRGPTWGKADRVPEFFDGRFIPFDCFCRFHGSLASREMTTRFYRNDPVTGDASRNMEAHDREHRRQYRFFTSRSPGNTALSV